VEAVRCAVAIVDYCIDVWRYLQGVNALPSSRTEDVMDAIYQRFLAWLETRPKRSDGLLPGKPPRPCATRRQCQQWSRLKAPKFAALIAEHAERFPGSVVTLGAREGQGRGAAGGTATVLVYAPERVQGGTRSVFARTPNIPMTTPVADAKDTGHVIPVRCSQPQTPNDGNTEPRTPNHDEASADGSIPDGGFWAQDHHDARPSDTRRDPEREAITLVHDLLGGEVIGRWPEKSWPEGTVGADANANPAA
jgi:hypothetical protein